MNKQTILKPFFWLFLILFLTGSWALITIDTAHQTDVTSYGVISFEFCGFLGICDAAVEEWGYMGSLKMMLSLGLDYLYLFLYPSLLTISIMLLYHRNGQKDNIPLTLLLGSAGLMAAADAIENYGLIQIVLNGAHSPYPLLSSIAATIKFALLAILLSWLLYLAIRTVAQSLA